MRFNNQAYPQFRDETDIRTPVIDMLTFLQWDNLSERWKKANAYHCIQMFKMY